MRRGAALTPLAASLVVASCATPLATRSDYEASVAAFRAGDPRAAALQLPDRESGSFIAVLERGYLDLLAGKGDPEPLREQAAAVEERVRYDVSREVKSLFYVETPEGYFASEHEVVWLHLLTSWAYSQRADYENGCVAARRASHLLSAPWSPEGRFDDALLRVVLATLWAWCGEWHEAQVDFRRAADLDGSLGWARELADRTTPPADLVLVLGGVGPAPAWKPEIAVNALRGVRRVKLELTGRRSPLGVGDLEGRLIAGSLCPDASYWYERHLRRDSAIHELVEDSTYFHRALTYTAKDTSMMVGGVALGIAGTVLSIAAGAAVIALGGNEDAVKLGFLVAIGGSSYSIGFATKTVKSSASDLKEELDPAETYRFVRFLPEYAWLATADEELAYPLELIAAGEPAGTVPAPAQRVPRVSIGHVPDVDRGRR